MEPLSCISSIRSRYDTLTAAERRIADVILQNAEDVVQMSVESLAARAGTAKSAVIRCSRSLGFPGYAQLKLSLAAELSKNRQLGYTPYIYPDDTAGQIVEKVFSANVKALHDTLARLDASLVERVLAALHGARQIFLYGVGTSAGMVTELQYRLMQLGYPAFAFTDPGAMKVSTMNIDSRDVAFAISYSGRTIATTETMALAAQTGAATVCITSYPDSPLARLCEHCICVWCDEVRYPVEAMSAKLAQLSLIYALTTALSAKNSADAAARAARTRSLIESIRMEAST